MLNKAFGILLRNLRRSQAMTQEQLGLRADLHRTYVSQLERGLKSPSLNTMARLAECLGVRLAEMLAKIEGSSAGHRRNHGKEDRD